MIRMLAGFLMAWSLAAGAWAQDYPSRPIRMIVAFAPGGVVDTAAAKAAVKVAVKVTVTLAPALAAQAQPGDALFIAARAVDGPPMPLAVSRHTVAELPLTITLDDSMAMMPGHSLANVEQFYVMARISKSGTANAAAGDLEGKSATVQATQSTDVAISIDHTLP